MSSAQWLTWSQAVSLAMHLQGSPSSTAAKRQAQVALLHRAVNGLVDVTARKWTRHEQGAEVDCICSSAEADACRLEFLNEVLADTKGYGHLSMDHDYARMGDFEAQIERPSSSDGRHTSTLIRHSILGLQFKAADIYAAFGATPPTENKASGGRPPKWDWEGAIAHVAAHAHTPDGLPTGHGAQAAIGRIITQWFRANQGGEPAPSEVGRRAAKIMAEIDRHRKPHSR